MNNHLALLISFLAGLFIILGSLISLTNKDNKKFVNFTFSIALGVMLSLIILELLPEAFHLFRESFNLFKTLVLIVIFSLGGILLLKGIDRLIPHHHHEDNEPHLFHIGLVSSIGLILHNFIEGMAIYGMVNNSLSVGLLFALGVGLHNIPLGMVLSSTIKSKFEKRNWLLIILVSISCFIGGLLMYLFNTEIFTNLFLGCLLAITNGMLLYICFGELWHEVWHTKYKQNSIIGFLTGIIIIVISMFLE